MTTPTDTMATANVPIVVDLDGTLTPTDTLLESLVQLIKSSPLNLLKLPLSLTKGRAEFKAWVASKVRISAELLPYNEALLGYLREEKQKGRRIFLATAAHESIAKPVFEHLKLFDEVLSTNNGNNLKGKAKLEAIQEKVGREFVYAGDCSADVPIWKASTAAILVGLPSALSKSIRSEVAVEREFPKSEPSIAEWLKALRVHQWLKNLLLFVPLLTAFSFFDPAKIINILLAFVAFSLAASATYMVNDLWDLENDRRHPRKRYRPFASAKISIPRGISVAFICLMAAFALAALVSASFFAMLFAYLILTSAYSWVLKEYVLIDVLMLSLLYTLRILAGSVAIGVATSSWLLAFSVFLFLSLALVKRCAELVTLGESGASATRGRDYRVSDLVVLWPLGVGAALSAVVVFGLFISSPETQQRYATPQLLWIVALGLIYWLSRLWIKTSRGEMHDDPVVFAIKNKGSRIAVIAMVCTMVAAHFLNFGATL